MALVVDELQRQFFSKHEKLTLEEANLFRSIPANIYKGFTVGAVVGSGLTWIATRRLIRFNRMGLGIGAAAITGAWGVETCLNSWIDHVLTLEGTRIQKELVSVIVQKFPDNPRRKQLISKHFCSERVFDDSTSDQLQLRRRYWNLCVDNAAFSQSTPDSDNHSDSDSKQNDLESKQAPIIGAEDGITVSASVSNNSICKTMVETEAMLATGQAAALCWPFLGDFDCIDCLFPREALTMLISAALLGPIAYLGQMPLPLVRSVADAYYSSLCVTPNCTSMKFAYNRHSYWLGLHEFDPREEAVTELLKAISKAPGIHCTDLMSSFTGQHCCLNSSITNAFLDHELQLTATNYMIHLAQMIRQGTIAMYDYRKEDENMEHCGQPTQPLYNIPNDLPLFIIYGGKDKLSDVDDVQTLLESLKDRDDDKLVVQYRQDYAHADFAMAVNANQVV